MYPHGVSTLTSKFENIQNFLLPKSIKSLQTFTCIVNFYHRFIQNAAQIIQHLYNLIDKGSRLLEWNSLSLKAFNEIKQRMANLALLVYPKRDAQISLTAEASVMAVGCIVLEFHEALGGLLVYSVGNYYCHRVNAASSIQNFVRLT
ncbi:Retrovirus-related Pol polyprotein [Thelohanellus kitauei]|uniref:Retrovirus-related Pol polyprotein n=1 Tax=Thelohanellus kitauei TaxID=669202 RepID=A0A0C2NCT9_THEKT|nr:Retrovirus-related Pol polyprotein [Thelohanellus kitauei]